MVTVTCANQRVAARPGEWASGVGRSGVRRQGSQGSASLPGKPGHGVATRTRDNALPLGSAGSCAQLLRESCLSFRPPATPSQLLPANPLAPHLVSPSPHLARDSRPIRGGCCRRRRRIGVFGLITPSELRGTELGPVPCENHCSGQKKSSTSSCARSSVVRSRRESREVVRHHPQHMSVSVPCAAADAQ